MCTLVAAFDPDAVFPLVVAANRDEQLARPSSPPRIWGGAPPFLAPRDEKAGGSWLGLNARGLFVAITNRFGVMPEESRASRGELVVKALASPDAMALHIRLAALSPRTYNAFHLLYADRARAFVTWSDGERIQQQELRRGLHVVTERSLGGDDHARTELIQRHAAPLRRHAGPTLEELSALVSQHAEDRIGSVCVHVPELGYGTKSSMLLWLGRSLVTTRMAWAEGPPCTTPFVDQTPLVAELRDRQLGQR